ncbi:ead/Ea22-like family protein [Shigella boydii]|uniref:ead/Ea22-like family protein n=1 Tax=Shigella boydii TaxID=621 RepID=UPI0035D4B961
MEISKLAELLLTNIMKNQRVTVLDVGGSEVLALLDLAGNQDNRIAELEKIATDYALKFQKAQDALKHAAFAA